MSRIVRSSNNTLNMALNNKGVNTVTKRELYQTYIQLLADRGMSRIDGIHSGSNKSELQAAINCLSCDNKTLDVFMDVVKEIYPNIADTALKNGDWHRHCFNRFYIYCLAVTENRTNAA